MCMYIYIYIYIYIYSLIGSVNTIDVYELCIGSESTQYNTNTRRSPWEDICYTKI